MRGLRRAQEAGQRMEQTMTTRRGFLGGLAGVLAAGFAPAAIGSGVLMPVRKIAVPEVSGMSILIGAQHQFDTEALIRELAQQRRELVRYGVLKQGDTIRIRLPQPYVLRQDWVTRAELQRRLT